MFAFAAPRFDVHQLQSDRARQAPNDPVLNLEHVLPLRIEAFGPHRGVGVGIDQLGIDPHLIALGDDASFEQIAHIKIAADLPGVDLLPPVGKGSASCHHKTARQCTGQIGRQILGDPVDEIILLRIAAQVCEWQYNDRQSGCPLGRHALRTGQSPQQRQRQRRQRTEIIRFAQSGLDSGPRLPVHAVLPVPAGRHQLDHWRGWADVVNVQE